VDSKFPGYDEIMRCQICGEEPAVTGSNMTDRMWATCVSDNCFMRGERMDLDMWNKVMHIIKDLKDKINNR